MPLDSLSYAAPARLRALVCPLGRIRRSRFAAFSARLNSSYVVRLGDVTPDPQRPLFSPQGCPDGRVIYELTTALDREHEYVEDFELHRRTLAVIAVADYTENNSPEKLSKQLEELKFMYPRAIHHVCLLFDAPADALEQDGWPKSKNPHADYPSFIPVLPQTNSRVSTMRTVMCDITAAILSEMHNLAKSFQNAGFIDSPMASSNSRPGSREHRLSLPTGGLSVGTGVPSKRTTMIGTGSGTSTPVGDRIKGKGNARVQIAIAQLHLISGRTPDALKEFTEAAEACKLSNDHLWHGKALEGIGVCCVILSHLRIHFQIPLIPHPTPEGASKSSKPSSPAPQPYPQASPNGVGFSSTPEQVLTLLAELNTAIVGLYLRSAIIPSEKIPHISYCESILRHAKALTSQYLSNGDPQIAISHMVTGLGLPAKTFPDPNGPSRVDIAASVMRAYPHNMEAFTVLEATKILSGIASVHGAIGMARRKGLVTRELVKILIPGLIQARVVGAAEVGVHPAAGLSALSAGPHGSPLDLGEDDVESGVIDLLEDLCRSYGVLPGRPSAGEIAIASEVPAATRAVIAEQEIRSFGWPALKIHVLRNCTSLCEALPDFEGVLKFTTQLLRMADEQLTKEEQVRLSTTISRTVAAARKLGLENVEADYWDQFLLRDVELVENNTWRSPIPHSSDELAEDDSDLETPRSSIQPIKADKTPFIYNPSKETEASAATELFMVAGESSEFKITLQNPFEFEIEVESVTLDATGVELEVQAAGVVIPPYRTCQVSVSATPKTTGEVQITGCNIKVYGCRERSYPIFCEGLDARDRDVKTKRFGLRASEPKVHRPMSAISQTRNSVRPPAVLHPVPKMLSLNVVDAQPLLVVKHTSLSQSALMILEGEKISFKMTLQNMSRVDVDLLMFNFTDSTTARIQQALVEKDSSPAERYELELMLERKKAFNWKREKPSASSASGRKVYVPAQGTATFTIEALGKPGLTHGVIEASYSHLGRPRSSFTPDQRFFTRQLQYPVTVTVNASTELARVDIIPFSSAVSAETAAGIHAVGAFAKLFSKESLKRPSDYCLLLIDLRNAWPQPLKVTLDISDTPFADLSSSDDSNDNNDIYTISEVIQAGHTTRFVLPIHRIFLANSIAPIPSLTASQRQFVVSATKISLTAERKAREAFWFREALLARLRGRWEEVGGGAERSGEVELRGIRLSQRMVDTVRIEDVGVVVEIVPDDDDDNEDENDDDDENNEKDIRSASPPHPQFQQLSATVYQIPSDTFATLRTHIHNRTSRALHLILRLTITLKSQPIAAALDLGRRLALNGVPQMSIGVVEPGETKIVETGMVGLARGNWEVLGSVEVVRGSALSGRNDGGAGDGAAGSGGEDPDVVIVETGLGEDGLPVDVLSGEGGEGRWCWVSREIVGVTVV